MPHIVGLVHRVAVTEKLRPAHRHIIRSDQVIQPQIHRGGNRHKTGLASSSCVAGSATSRDPLSEWAITSDGANERLPFRAVAPPAPGNAATRQGGAIMPAIKLSGQITDQSGVLGPLEYDAVNRALTDIYNGRGTRLWVVYVPNFGGLRPFRSAGTMVANNFTDSDAILAVATEEGLRLPGAQRGDHRKGHRSRGHARHRDQIIAMDKYLARRVPWLNQKVQRATVMSAALEAVGLRKAESTEAILRMLQRHKKE